MIFGIPLEVRNHEYRVGGTPHLVEEIIKRGHQVIVESKAGEGSGFSDDDYENSGAIVIPSPEKLYGQSEIILKVHRPMPVEYDLIRPEHTIFAYFYLHSHLDMSRSLLGRGCTCFSFDLFERTDGSRPFLELEYEMAGRSALVHAQFLMQRQNGGRGKLISAGYGSESAVIAVVGNGRPAICLAMLAEVCGADVHLLEPVAAWEEESEAEEPPEGGGSLATSIQRHPYGDGAISRIFPDTDILISATQPDITLKQPFIGETAVEALPRGCVIIDLDVDFGGGVFGSRSTTHESPFFQLDEKLYYCVPNLASSVPATASPALSNQLLPWLTNGLDLDAGLLAYLSEHPELSGAFALHEGRVVNLQLAEMIGVANYPLAGTNSDDDEG